MLPVLVLVAAGHDDEDAVRRARALGLAGVGELILMPHPRLRTPVDIRSKYVQEVSLCLTFRSARRDFPTANLGQEVVPCQADRA